MVSINQHTISFSINDMEKRNMYCDTTLQEIKDDIDEKYGYHLETLIDTSKIILHLYTPVRKKQISNFLKDILKKYKEEITTIGLSSKKSDYVKPRAFRR